MPRKFKLRRHRKNEDRFKAAKTQKTEETLDSAVFSLPISAFNTTSNIVNLKHRLEVVGEIPEGM